MIIKGQAVSEKGVNYRLNFLKYGQETIKQFPLLHKILKDFPDFSESKYDENYFLILASKARHDIFRNGPNSMCYDKLKEYENLLKEVGFDNMKSRKRHDIDKKMNSFDKQQNHAICKELEFLDQLKKHPNIKQAFYDNFEKSNHDFRIFVDDEQFNLEFTSASDSETHKILEKSFDRIAEELMNYIPDGKYLKLDLKTDLLLNDSNRMDEDYICKLVIEKAKDIFPIIFAKDNGYCSIESRMGDPNKPFYESRNYYEHYREWGDRLSLLLSSEEGKKFLMNTSFASLGKFPISRFMYCPSGARIVEVHSQSQWPSRSEELRKSALLNQFSRLILSKINKGQLKGQKNPIIVIQFADVIFDEYLNENDPFGPGKLSELQEQINSAFKQTSNSEILGVILIEDYLSKSKFIPNPNINLNNDLLSRIEIFSKIN